MSASAPIYLAEYRPPVRGVWAYPWVDPGAVIGSVYVDGPAGLDGLLAVCRVTHEVRRSPSRAVFDAAVIGWRPARRRGW